MSPEMPKFALPVISPCRDVRGLMAGHGVGMITLLLAVPIPNKSQAELGKVKLGYVCP